MKKFSKVRKVIFLDRDGVINKRMPPHHYVRTWKGFKFLPGVILALRLFKRHGYDLFVITNQRGIARGSLSEADLENVHQWMKKKLKERGVKLNGIYYCPHDNHENCECRKPKPGMLFAAARDHHLDLAQAIFIGDSSSDVAAGKAAGCKTILIKETESLLDIAKSLITN